MGLEHPLGCDFDGDVVVRKRLSLKGTAICARVACAVVEGSSMARRESEETGGICGRRWGDNVNAGVCDDEAIPKFLLPILVKNGRRYRKTDDLLAAFPVVVLIAVPSNGRTR